MKKTIIPHLFLICVALFWGLNPVIGQVLLDTFHPVLISTFRWLIALCVLLPVTLLNNQIDFSIVKRHWKNIFLAALLGITLFQTLTYIAVQYTSPINITLITTATPILIAIFSYFHTSESLNVHQITGMILATIGVLWIISQGDVSVFVELNFNRGDLIMILAVFAWAGYSMVSKELIKDFQLITSITICSVLGVLLLVPAALWALVTHPPLHITFEAIAGLILLALTASILAFLWYNLGIKSLGTNVAAMYMYLIPVFTGVTSFIILRELLNMHQILGGMLVGYGVYLTTRKTKKELVERETQSA
ncbi:drug/metabolite transporter (DMT)-like permease [Caldalkalibacillus uzonensis]|uniref:Drug/metabolite transporter (DMT)-like permease n=1 Tax=Caldalkalibacillus uzonensis TaxID=353224 RepID=A0ABU0CYE7_9BACI|nr:DMT family transporter [Caldalkalibacillus uzonensis]MDQ0341177.1 drug/metabolite transporter (DMT)-like permease [Caldalkalibacillus uzonensis]